MKSPSRIIVLFLLSVSVSSWTFPSPKTSKIYKQQRTNNNAFSTLRIVPVSSSEYKKISLYNNIRSIESPNTTHSKKPNQENNLISSAQRVFKLILSGALALSLLFSTFTQPSFAVETGGRIGGSTGSFSRSSGSSSRGYSSAPSARPYSGYSPSRSTVILQPRYGYSSYSYGPNFGGGVVIQRGPSLFDVLFTGAFAYIVISSVASSIKGSSDNDLWSSSSSNSVLGPGISVAKLSLAIEIPDRTNTSNILTYLSKLSETANTDSRVGLQNLLSQVSLELLRKKSSLFASSLSFQHFPKDVDAQKAQREYNAVVIKERSKFEKETVSVYNGVDYSPDNTSFRLRDAGSSLDYDSGKATCAVVTLIFAIDGDSLKKPMGQQITDISTISEVLAAIAADSKIDDCLKSVEVLWTPTGKETLTRREIYEDFPELKIV